MNELTAEVRETQRQIELVDTPPIFAPHQILVTDSSGQIVDSGIPPSIIMHMHAMLQELAKTLRELFIVE
jgi:hypothetical protein